MARSDDYALVWNGTSWGNAQVLDAVAGDNLTDIYVAYEQQSGDAMVVYGQNSADASYRIWNGSTWSAGSSITKPAGVTGNARWTTMASDPTTDRIILGVSTNANEMWLSRLGRQFLGYRDRGIGTERQRDQPADRRRCLRGNLR